MLRAMDAWPLSPELLDALARCALGNLAREYPFHLSHLAENETQLAPPRQLHPVFFGSYDWHSSVHMHWTLVRLLRLDPGGDAAQAICAHFDARLTATAVTGECDYFSQPGRVTFERPYGWGWLLHLAAELRLLAEQQPQAARWAEALEPLAALITRRFCAWLPRADYPVRAGTHGNSAFALVLARRSAERRGDSELLDAIDAAARRWFLADRDYPADYEPGGEDFLSPGLCEALLMARCLAAQDWASWWTGFVPRHIDRWLTPAVVADASDAKIVHLHGLNLSRAWCWRCLLPLLAPELRQQSEAAVASHLAASLPAATTGEYVGTHWLASFALLALSGETAP
jgi:Protein of unknown function (DUF2891)